MSTFHGSPSLILDASETIEDDADAVVAALFLDPDAEAERIKEESRKRRKEILQKFNTQAKDGRWHCIRNIHHLDDVAAVTRS